MKLTVIGGGGFRTPYIYHALLADRDPWVDEVALLDPAPRRLQAMKSILDEMAVGHVGAPRITLTTDPSAAITGSDVVCCAVRVGGLDGRRTDEHVAADLGVLGQETTGPGGIAFSLRTVPVMLEYARLIADLAPAAWVMNFTNPAGIITEAMQSVLGDRVVGVCDTPSGLVRRTSEALGVAPDGVVPDYVGLNHLGWLNGLGHDGIDLLPALLRDDAKLAALEEATVFGVDWLRRLGCIPNEYLYYYYENREAVAATATRGDALARSQSALFASIGARPGQAFELWRRAVLERNASYMALARGADPAVTATISDDELFEEGYATVAIGVTRAILRDERTIAILNVRNGGTVAALPADAVVEVPCEVTGQGATPLLISQPTLHQAGLMQQVKHVERLAIEAATTGDRDTAVAAFGLHPLVDSFSVATQLLDAYVARHPELTTTFAARH